MKRHRGYAALSVLIGFLGLLATQAQATSASEHHPIQAAWPRPLPVAGPTTAAEMEAFIDGFMAVQLSAAPAAGATVSVVKDGQLFFTKGYGYADVDKRVPVDPGKTLFRPGSISKTFTWTAVMQLVEQHKLDLDTDVNRYLTDFKIPAPFGLPVTLRNLMTHTAGFEDGAVGYLFKSSPAGLVPIDQFLRAHIPAQVRPPTTDFNSGANASYSNWGTVLAGRLVEIASGQQFDDYIQQHIFEPLGMTRSTFHEPVPTALSSDLAGGYEFEGGQLEQKTFEYIHSAGPAGSLSTTATDMAKFMLAHLQQGAAQILSPATEELMQTRTLSPDPALNGSLLGFYETYINGRRIIGHGGDTTHFHSEMALLPEAKLGLFVSVNSGGEAASTATRLQTAFFEHYFPAELPKVSPPADADNRNERYAGTYRVLRHSYTKFEKVFSIAGDNSVVAMPDGTLLMNDPTDKAARWIEVGEGVFRQANADVFVAFKDIRDGRAQALVGPFSPIASARIAWYETGSLHEWIIGACVLIFIATIIGALRHWRVDRLQSDGLRWARPTLALACLMLLGFLCAVLFVLGGGIATLIYDVPSSLRVALTFPLLALVPAGGSLFFTFKAWSSSTWQVRRRLSYTFTTFAVVLFLLILNYWNLLGYRFG